MRRLKAKRQLRDFLREVDSYIRAIDGHLLDLKREIASFREACPVAAEDFSDCEYCGGEHFGVDVASPYAWPDREQLAEAESDRAKDRAEDDA